MIECPACKGEGWQSESQCEICRGWGFTYLVATPCPDCRDPRDRVIWTGTGRPHAKVCQTCNDERWIRTLLPYEDEPYRVPVSEVLRVLKLVERSELIHADEHPDAFLIGIVMGLLLNLNDNVLLGAEPERQLAELEGGELVFTPLEIWHVKDTNEGVVLYSFR